MRFRRKSLRHSVGCFCSCSPQPTRAYNVTPAPRSFPEGECYLASYLVRRNMFVQTFLDLRCYIIFAVPKKNHLDLGLDVFAVLKALRTDLIKFHWPCGEFIEQSGSLRRARNKRFREDVKQRRSQSLCHYLLRNRKHEQVQQLDVVQRSILKLASIAHTNVYCEIQTARTEFALGILVIPKTGEKAQCGAATS